MATIRVCAIEGCDKPVFCRKWCGAHYARWRRHGDPLSGGPEQTPGAAMSWIAEHLAHDGSACLTWPFSRAWTGYPNVIRFQGKNVPAHRVVCRMAHGPPPTEDHHAAHSCGRGKEACVSPSHLRWATAVENTADKWRHGTMPVGRSTLTHEIVLEIYAKRGKARQFEVAQEMGVSKSVVRGIWTGVNWRWLTGAPDDCAKKRRANIRVSRRGHRASDAWDDASA